MTGEPPLASLVRAARLGWATLWWMVALGALWQLARVLL